jgi:IMP dehydrogenase
MRILQKALTFDDVLLVPAESSGGNGRELASCRRDVSLKTRFSAHPWHRVEYAGGFRRHGYRHRSAHGHRLAQEGGIGIIHKNLTPEQQAAEVAKVKRHESGVVKDPITISPTMSVRDVLDITRRYRISGLPVIDKTGKVVGIVTNRDLRFETNLDQHVRHIMTPRKRLVTVKEGVSKEDIVRFAAQASPGAPGGDRRRLRPSRA